MNEKYLRDKLLFFASVGRGGREVEGLLSLLRSVGLLNINKEDRKLTVN